MATLVAGFLQLEPAELGQLSSGLLSRLESKAHEFENLRSREMMLQVNLEQAEHNSSNDNERVKEELLQCTDKVRSLESVLEQKTKTTSDLEAKLNTLRSHEGESTGDARANRLRVKTLEAEKADVVEALERKIRELNSNAEEFDMLQKRYNETRRQVSDLETSTQETSSKLLTSSVKESNLNQELQMAKNSAGWFEGELKQKTTDFSNFRKDKIGQISGLQGELDATISKADASQQKADRLASKLEEVNGRLETALSKIKNLQDSSVTEQEGFQAELNSRQRLCELWERSAKEARSRVDELTNIVEKERSTDTEEFTNIISQMEAEKERADLSETKIAELASTIEKLEVEVFALRSRQRGETPSANVFSPSATLLASSPGGNINLTQLCEELQQARAQLDQERHRSETLQYSCDELVKDIEARAPEILEQRAENERLQTELAEMSEMLQEATVSRDLTLKQYKSLETLARDSEIEVGLQRQQMKDLGRQIGQLLFLQEIQNSDMSGEELEVLRQISEHADEGLGLSDTDILINERLTIFKNIQELQSQNQNLLKVTRELGQRLEREEKETRKRMGDLESSAVDEARNVIDNLREELKASKVKAESFMRERDMFRRMMLTSREGDFNVSRAAQEEPQENPVDYSNLLRDLQVQFDAYRNETAVDNRTLNDQIKKLAGENSKLQIQVARDSSQLELSSERQKIVSDTMEMMRKENDDLRSRNTKLHETVAKQDTRTQQVVIESVDLTSTNESLRAELSNLKSEKELWKSVEARIVGENTNLQEEKNRLSSLLVTLQTWRSDFELAEGENKKRLLMRIENLENDLSSTRKRLAAEVDESRNISFRREMELREHHERLQNASLELASTKEELASAKATCEGLNSKVEELNILLSTANEKIELLHYSDSGPQQPDNFSARELQLEMSELRSELNLRKKELQNSKLHADRMKDVGASAEEALQNLSHSYDEYKANMESEFQDKEASLSNLNERIEALGSELASHNDEITRIRSEEASNRQSLLIENEALKSEVEVLKKSDEWHASVTSALSEDIRMQARIANEAQQNYERELVKHAEAAQSLQALREEQNSLHAQLRESQNKAESTSASLLLASDSWDIQRDTLEKEMRQMTTRCDELVQHNKLLHSQYESLSTQISKIGSQHETNGANGENDESAISTLKSTEELRDVVRYLRHEKEIVDVQYELSVQESKRQKHQLLQLQSAVDEMQLQISQQGQRESDLTRSSAQHQELLVKINELNILRESNVALRLEMERNFKNSTDLSEKLNGLQSRVEPLEDQNEELKSDLEVKEQQIVLLEQDNERWKNRAQQILQKYERIDPVELQNLKEELENLRKNLDAARDQKDIAVREAEGRTSEIALSWKAKFDTLVTQSKERLSSLRVQLKAAKAAIQSKDAEIETLQQDQQQLQSRDTISDKADDSHALSNAVADSENLRQLITQLTNEKTSIETRTTDLESELTNVKSKSQRLVHSLRTQLQEAKETQSTAADEMAGEQKSQENALAHSNEEEIAQRVSAEMESAFEARMNDARAQWEDEKEQAVKSAIEEQIPDGENEQAHGNDETLARRIKEVESRLETEFEDKLSTLAGEHESALQAAVDEAVKKVNADRKPPPTREQLKKLIDRRVAQDVAKAKDHLEAEKSTAIDEAIKTALQEKEEELQQRVIADAENPDAMAHMRDKVKITQLQKRLAEVEKQNGGSTAGPSDSSPSSAANRTLSMSSAQTAIPTPSLSIRGGRGSMLPRGGGTGRGREGHGRARPSPPHVSSTDGGRGEGPKSIAIKRNRDESQSKEDADESESSNLPVKKLKE